MGYKVHLTETCDADQPDLITQVLTTPATTQDSVMDPAIQQDLADRDLLPGTHLLDKGDKHVGRNPCSTDVQDGRGSRVDVQFGNSA